MSQKMYIIRDIVRLQLKDYIAMLMHFKTMEFLN